MAADEARAETYLRLMVEAELRRALTLPRYQPPTPPGLPAPVRAAHAAVNPAVRLARTASTAIAARSGSAQAMQAPAGRVAMNTMTVVGRRVTRMAATASHPAIEPVLPRMARVARQLVWRSRWAHWIIQRAPRGMVRGPGPAMTSVHRVRQVADALVMAGAMNDVAATSIVDSLADALTARAKLDDGQLYRPGGPLWPVQPPPALPTGPVRAAPVGGSVRTELDGMPGSGWLLTLVLAPDRVCLTAAGRFTGLDADGRPGNLRPQRQPVLPDLDQITATDDHGGIYQVGAYGGRGGGGTWSRTFEFTPMPPPGVRWLDIAVPSRGMPIRVDLAPVGPGQPQAGRVEVPAELAAVDRCCAADRLLDAWSVSLLGQAARTGQARSDKLSGLAEVAGALRAVGTLRPGCAALGRLASLSGELGLSFPASLRESAPRAGLPEAWSGVLADRGAADGLDRAAPVTAVLPELDEARFVLAGLVSTNHSATLHVLAWGWQPDRRPTLGGLRFSWWARDNVGRWHVGTEGGSGFGSGRVDLELQFRPPVHPRATALDIFVIGPASAAGVTVPLDWRAAQ